MFNSTEEAYALNRQAYVSQGLRLLCRQRRH